MTIPVTEAESEVLAALWRRGPLSAKPLIEEVKSVQDWGESTIKTLLGRLMKKGAILSERVDGRQQYRALISRSDYVRREIGLLARRLFGGDQQALLAALKD